MEKTAVFLCGYGRIGENTTRAAMAGLGSIGLMYEASRQMISYYNAFQKFYRIENSNQLSRLPGCYGIQQCLYFIHACGKHEL